MATINKRKDQDGNTRFQVIIRLKGHPTQTATFTRVTDAKKWAQHTEAAISRHVGNKALRVVVPRLPS